MKVITQLNYRGMQENTTKENRKYYTYYFEDNNGVPTSFNSSELFNLEKGKNYNLQFNCVKMFFDGFTK